MRGKIFISLAQLNIVYFVIILLQDYRLYRLSNKMLGYTQYVLTQRGCHCVGRNVFQTVAVVQPYLLSTSMQLGPIHLALTKFYRMRT